MARFMSRVVFLVFVNNSSNINQVISVFITQILRVLYWNVLSHAERIVLTTYLSLKL